MSEYILGKVNTTFSLWRVDTDESTKTKTFTREKVVSRSEEKAKSLHPDLKIDDTLQGTMLVRTYADLNDLTTYTETKGKKTTSKKEATEAETNTAPKKRGRKPKSESIDTEESVEPKEMKEPKKRGRKPKIDNDDDDLDIEDEFSDKINRASKYSDIILGSEDDSEFDYEIPDFSVDDLEKMNVDDILADTLDYDDDEELF